MLEIKLCAAPYYYLIPFASKEREEFVLACGAICGVVAFLIVKSPHMK